MPDNLNTLDPRGQDSSSERLATQSGTLTPAEVALALIEQGHYPVRVRGKDAFDKGWQDKRLKADDVEEYWRDSRLGVGVLCGLGQPLVQGRRRPALTGAPGVTSTGRKDFDDDDDHRKRKEGPRWTSTLTRTACSLKKTWPSLSRKSNE
jgi:hypothetical protein